MLQPQLQHKLLLCSVAQNLPVLKAQRRKCSQRLMGEHSEARNCHHHLNLHLELDLRQQAQASQLLEVYLEEQASQLVPYLVVVPHLQQEICLEQQAHLHLADYLELLQLRLTERIKVSLLNRAHCLLSQLMQRKMMTKTALINRTKHQSTRTKVKWSSKAPMASSHRKTPTRRCLR